MSLFPFFIECQGKRGFIAGGGHHALDKICKMKEYGPTLEVYALHPMQEMVDDHEIILHRRRINESDLDQKPTFVIAADEDVEVNHWIVEQCRKRGILVNAVDDQPYCDFVFPSLIHHGQLSIGICTNGASPATGVLLRKRIEQIIPCQIEAILDDLQKKRPEIIKALVNKKQRFAFYYQLASICMDENRCLTDFEFQQLLKEVQDFNE